MADSEFQALEDLVRSDIEAGLVQDRDESRAPFAPWTAESENGILYSNAIAGDALTAVEWAFQCQHVGTFSGIPATGRVVTIQGVTIVRVRGGETTFRRYVDWAGVMADLGVSASFRPAYERIDEIPNINVSRRPAS